MTQDILPITALAALFASACTGATTPSSTDTDVPPPATADWMGDVFADHQDAQVGHILLPGAFNSTSYACAAPNGISPHAPPLISSLWGTSDTGTDDLTRQRVVAWARTQDVPIGAQLDLGARFIEMNLTLKDDALVTWHSIYGVRADDVLDPLVAFAVRHPAEVVLLQLGLDMDSTAWPKVADAFTKKRAGGKSVCDLIYDGADNAAVASLADIRARGRNVIWGPDGELRAFFDARGDCPMSTLTVDRRWSITATTEGVAAALADSVDSRDPTHVLVNDFAFSLDGAPSVGDQAGFVLRYGSVKEASTALGFSGDFAGRMITQFDVNANMNVFAGAMIEDTNLVEAAIARNRERLAP